MTIRVTIELVPFGDEYKKQMIDVLNISNIGMVDWGVCQYAIERNDYRHADETTPRVEHTRSDGVLVLVHKALERIIKNESADT